MIHLVQLKAQLDLQSPMDGIDGRHEDQDTSTGGSVVECSLATRATRVAFPASALLSFSSLSTYVSIGIGHFSTCAKTVHAVVAEFPFLDEHRDEQ